MEFFKRASFKNFQVWGLSETKVFLLHDNLLRFFNRSGVNPENGIQRTYTYPTREHESDSYTQKYVSPGSGDYMSQEQNDNNSCYQYPDHPVGCAHIFFHN